MGSVSQDAIARHRRLRQFTWDDYGVLISLIDQVERVLVTPNTLPETSNLLGWTLRILGISTVWYNKPFPTFLGVIALARPHLWLTSEDFSRSLVEPDTWKVPAALYHQLIHS